MDDLFRFKVSPKSRAFCLEIAEVIERLGARSPDQAVDLVNRFWRDVSDIDSPDHMLFHETPYFYAMTILHHPEIGDNQPIWWKDDRYWPPPAWVKSRWYTFDD